MPSPSSSEQVLDALRAYFSPPIAKALLASTLKRANVDGAALDGDTLPRLMEAFERLLPVYLSDSVKRKACMAQLRGMAGMEGPPSLRPGANGVGGTHGGAGAPVAGSTATVIRVRNGDDVMNACEVGKDLCRKLGFASVDQTKVATAIAEFARNIVQYAKDGEIRISALSSPRRGIEVWASDDGPGIRDLELVMSTTYKSKTGMGMGLKGSRKLMDDFEIKSAPDAGTKVLARKYVT